MMATIYELIGRMVVRFVRIRYRRQIRIALGIGIAGDRGRRLPGGDARATRGLGDGGRGLVPRLQDRLQARCTHSLAS